MNKLGDKNIASVLIKYLDPEDVVTVKRLCLNLGLLLQYHFVVLSERQLTVKDVPTIPKTGTTIALKHQYGGLRNMENYIVPKDEHWKFVRVLCLKIYLDKDMNPLEPGIRLRGSQTQFEKMVSLLKNVEKVVFSVSEGFGERFDLVFPQNAKLVYHIRSSDCQQIWLNFFHVAAKNSISKLLFDQGFSTFEMENKFSENSEHTFNEAITKSCQSLEEFRGTLYGIPKFQKIQYLSAVIYDGPVQPNNNLQDCHTLDLYMRNLSFDMFEPSMKLKNLLITQNNIQLGVLANFINSTNLQHLLVNFQHCDQESTEFYKLWDSIASSSNLKALSINAKSLMFSVDWLQLQTSCCSLEKLILLLDGKHCQSIVKSLKLNFAQTVAPLAKVYLLCEYWLMLGTGSSLDKGLHKSSTIEGGLVHTEKYKKLYRYK